MNLAINYSPQAVQLVAAKQIELDLLKCPDWPELLAAARAVCEVYVHFPLRAGRGKIDPAGLDRIAEMRQASRTPYVNMHLGPNASDFDMPLETRDPAHAAQLAEAMRRDILLVVDRFGAQQVILENSMWDPRPPYQIPRPVLEPDFIARIVHGTGCGFLLDLAHARIAAGHLGINERDYVRVLPVDRLRELHVSGLRQDADGATYDHFAMTEADWALTEWAIECIREGKWPRPWALTFEYGGVGPQFEDRSDASVIAEQTPRLLALARSVNR